MMSADATMIYMTAAIVLERNRRRLRAGDESASLTSAAEVRFTILELLVGYGHA